MNCQVMGIVNVTPDSFSDGGKYFRPEEAIRRARNLSEEGAEVIDLGGESTRPGAEALGWEEEWSRLEPVVGEVAKRTKTSVDTYHPETALRALERGAAIINCVYEKSVAAMLELLARFPAAELVVPFRPGDDFGRFQGVKDRIYLDPMIGFGTTREEDVELLRSIGELAKQGRVLVGGSRKRIVKKLTGENMTGKNLGGNLGLALYAAAHGASMVRVHDVKETVQALKVWTSLR